VSARNTSTAAITWTVTRWLAPAGQDADQPELGDPQAAGRDRQDGQQPDEREGGQRSLPGHLGLAEPAAAQAGQQDQPQSQLTRGRGRG